VCPRLEFLAGRPDLSGQNSSKPSPEKPKGKRPCVVYLGMSSCSTSLFHGDGGVISQNLGLLLIAPAQVQRPGAGHILELQIALRVKLMLAILFKSNLPFWPHFLAVPFQ
jgi:hypothetical protein